MNEPRVAIVTDYLMEFGGAERVHKAIHDIFPDATVFTSAFNEKAFPEEFGKWNIRTSSIDRLPLFEKLSKHYTFLYPFYFENFDLSDFDIIISSGTIWAKSVITKPSQLHIYYCHTPPRFLYHYSRESNKRDNIIYKPFLAYIDYALRVWDYASAQRPDFIVANSRAVSDRIKKFYNRSSEVIYPPVSISNELVLSERQDRFESDYFLAVGRLSTYKNMHLLIEAFNNLDFPLRIVGTGREEPGIRKLIRKDIALLGHLSDRELRIQYQNCKGVIFPVEDEDFGLVPVEAMSFGKPVLAHRSGGPLETIEDKKTGMFFSDLSPKGIMQAVLDFNVSIDASAFDPAYIKESARRFEEGIFKEKFKNFVLQKFSTLQ